MEAVKAYKPPDVTPAKAPMNTGSSCGIPSTMRHTTSMGSFNLVCCKTFENAMTHGDVYLISTSGKQGSGLSFIVCKFLPTLVINGLYNFRKIYHMVYRKKYNLLILKQIMDILKYGTAFAL